MASGHEYRANRPNTWLLQPLLQSEDSSCQPGAVHTWPIWDMPTAMMIVRVRGQSRKQILAPSSSQFGPIPDLGGCGTRHSISWSAAWPDSELPRCPPVVVVRAAIWDNPAAT